MAVSPVPDDRPTVCPYLLVERIPALLAFLEATFDGRVTHRTDDPSGATLHAEVRVGDAVLMMGASRPEWPPTAGSFYVYVTDTDAAYRRALAAGATSLMAPADQFYGDRNAGVKDPSGNTWWIATHVEDVSDEEIARRAAARG